MEQCGSSARSLCSSPGYSSSEEEAKLKAWWDAAAQTMVRGYPDGSVTAAVMEAGPSGFAVAVWPSGSRTETSVPNLDIAVQPAAICKRPAAASQQRRAAGLGQVPAARAKELLSSSFGPLRKTCAKDKSYVTYLDAAGKWRLLANVTAKTSPNHSQIVDRLMDFALGAGLTKEDVLKRRGNCSWMLD